MHPKSLRSIFSPVLLLLILTVFFPFGSSLSFDFPSFNQSASSLLNLGADASWSQVIHLTKYGTGALGSSTGRAVYPQPLLLWDSATRSLTDFITHFSFRIAVPGNTCSCSGLAFFLAPYPYTPPDISSDGYLGLFSKATARDTSKNQVVAAEFGTHRNKLDPSTCHVGIDVNSIDSPQSVDCNGGITSGGTSNATISYSSSTRSLTVLVVHEDSVPSRAETVSLSHVVDLRDILPSKVVIGFSAATADPSTERHEILSWDFSSTLQAPAANGSVAGMLDSKLNLLTGLVSTNLGASLGMGSLVIGYKLTLTCRRRREERDGRRRCRCRGGQEDSSIKTPGHDSPSPGSSPPPHHSQAMDPSLIKAMIHAVKVAVREEFQSRFDSTSPAVAHSRLSRVEKHSPPPGSGAPVAESDPEKGVLALEAGNPTEAVSNIPEHNPGDTSFVPYDRSAFGEAAAGHTEGRHAGAARGRRDARGAPRRSDRALRKGIFDWLYGKLFRSENLGCL